MCFFFQENKLFGAQLFALILCQYVDDITYGTLMLNQDCRRHCCYGVSGVPDTVHRQNVEVTNAEWTKRRTTKRQKPKRRMGQNIECKKPRMGQNVEWN